MLRFLRSFLPSACTRSAPSNAILHHVKVLNLPPREVTAIKKLFLSLGIKRYKKAPQWNYAYVKFATKSDALLAMSKLKGLKIKRNIIDAEYSQIQEEEFRDRFQKRSQSSCDEGLEKRSPSERLADQVTPLHKLPYEEQLLKKHRLGVKQLRSLRKKLMKLQEVSKHGKLQLRWTLDDLWTVEEPIGSPEIFGYRTKCEFSIGKNLNDEPTVGFLLGMYRDGVTSVIEPGDTIHIPEKAKAIAAIMQAYVRESRYPVYDRKTRKGVWRTIMVKVQNTGDVLLLIQISADDLDSHQLEREKQALINYWSVHGITTMMLQKWNGESHGVNIRGTTEILTGDGYVYEQLLEHQFRISSSAFFQVNTKATELLYAKCAEWCNLRDNGRKTTLLDLCCGCGSIGISIGKAADRVVGIEMNSDAIDDALFNVQLNMVTNAQYFASKVEEKIDIVANEQNEDVIAVLDPPRSGVHSSVIKAVRESSQIQKLIFISCDANQAMQNFVALCRPTSNKFQGIPFKPRRAVIVDLFPHTDHYELMVEFVRVNEQSE